MSTTAATAEPAAGALASPPAPPLAQPTASIARTVVNVAWMSILLGVGLELILLAIAAGAGPLTKLQPFAADLVQKVTWASMVCVGLALGNSAAKLRPHLTGLMGLLSAPLGFAAAKALHKSTEKALGLAGAAASAGPSPVMLAGLKAAEYAALGLLIGWLAKKEFGLPPYLTAGLGVGIVFGGTILGLMDWYALKPLTGPALLSRAVNEFLFPVGCSVILYAAESLSKRLTVGQEA